MNNILVENDLISFDEKTVYLDIKVKEVVINIKNNVVINELKTNNYTNKITINILDDSSLIYNKYNNDSSCNLNIEINIGNNSNFLGHFAFVAKKKNTINVKTIMNGSDISNNLYVKCVTKNEGSIDVRIDGVVIPNTMNNRMQESIKLLNLNNSNNRILPNMLVSTNEVKADHFATISGINKDELFYLRSKGISEKDAVNLLEKGFITGLFNKEIQEIINNEK